MTTSEFMQRTRYMKQSDQKCNDYPEIVSYETIGVGLEDKQF